jgi:periplasmic divalent cation tolerance protein
MTVLQVTTSVSSREAAERIALMVVERRLAACAQVAEQVTSIYRWKGVVESTPEWICVIKTDEARYAQLEEAIRSVHPAEVPEIIASPVTHGFAAYLQWVADETTPD